MANTSAPLLANFRAIEVPNCPNPITANLPSMCVFDFTFEESYNNIKRLFVAHIVWDYQVGILLKRLYVLFIRRCHVHFVAVEHIVEVVAALHLVADDAALELDMLFGINKKLEVEEL